MWKLAPVLLDRNPNQQRSGSNPNLGLYGTPYCPSVHVAGQNQSSALQQGGHGPVGTDSSPLTQCFWTFFWLAVLLALAYPIALCSIVLYVILSPLAAISSFASKCCDKLLIMAHWPSRSTEAMARADPLFTL